MSVIKTYVTGLVLSLALTLAAYFAVVEHFFSGWTLFVTITALGAVQAFVQLVLFLHLGQEPHPKWNLMVFLFMLLVLVVIVLGSLWIMYHLDYRMMM